MFRKIFYAAAFGLAILIIAYLSLAELQFRLPDLRLDFIDKLAHAFLYAAIMILGSLWLWESNERKDLKPTHLVKLGLALFAYGIIIEVLQHILPINRWAEILDVVANGVGIALGGLLVSLVSRNYLR